LQGFPEFLSNYNFEEANEAKLYESIIRKLLAASKKRR
jgi:aromatic ring-opening dioxygenase catalytic subunit (LigB family)